MTSTQPTSSPSKTRSLLAASAIVAALATGLAGSASASMLTGYGDAQNTGTITATADPAWTSAHVTATATIAPDMTNAIVGVYETSSPSSFTGEEWLSDGPPGETPLTAVVVNGTATIDGTQPLMDGRYYREVVCLSVVGHRSFIDGADQTSYQFWYDEWVRGGEVGTPPEQPQATDHLVALRLTCSGLTVEQPTPTAPAPPAPPTPAPPTPPTPPTPPPVVTPSAPKITAHPASRTKSRAAAFRFTDSTRGVTFKCRLDKRGAWRTCKSASYTKLARRSHTFEVSATLHGKTSKITTFAWKVTK